MLQDASQHVEVKQITEYVMTTLVNVIIFKAIKNYEHIVHNINDKQLTSRQ